MTKELFHENQRCGRLDVMIVLALYAVGLTWFFANQTMNADTLLTPMPLSAYLFLLLPGVGVLAYLLALRLSVRVTDKHICMSYFPRHKKKHKIKWQEVEECQLLEVPQSAVWDNLKLHASQGKTYGAAAKSGVHLTTKKGERIYVGVKRAKELEQAVRQAFPKVQLTPDCSSNLPGQPNFWRSIVPAASWSWLRL